MASSQTPYWNQFPPWMGAVAPLTETVNQGRVREALSTWRSRLLDLSKRNRLLYFRITRRSTLQVVGPGLDEMFGLLALSTKSRFVYVPRQAEDTEDAAEDEHWTQEPEARVPKDGELVTHIQDPPELRNILTNLYRKARSDYEERGIRVLHVTFGILRWRETPESEEALAPLVLLPVEITRQSSRGGFAFKNCEEDAVLNPCIEAKLENDFRIKLPNLPDDGEDIDISDYLKQIVSCVRSLGWSVSEEVWVGLFSFHKLAMYKDLEANEDLITENPLVQILAGFGAELPELPIPSERELDDKVSFDNTHLILEADSSQMMAIEAAKAGRSLVLQGPPGTGKSQTIANLIAECIALDQKVLFVSEKMAALEVVNKRLARRCLDNYVLELHSHKANKRAVVAELERSLKEPLVPGEGLTELEFHQLRELRAELNAYVRSLHRVRKPLNRTPYQVLGRLAALETVRPVAFRLDKESLLTPEALAHVLRLGQRMAPVWHIAREGQGFPWRGNKDQVYTPGAASEYLAQLASIQAYALRLSESMRTLCASLELAVDHTLAKCQFMTQLEGMLDSNPKPHPDWTLRLPTSPWDDEPDLERLLTEMSVWVDSAVQGSPWTVEVKRAVELGQMLSGFDLKQLTALDLDEIHMGFRTRYRSILRIFMSDYYADRRAIRGCAEDRSLPPNMEQFLGQALELRTLLQRICEALIWVRQLEDLFAAAGNRITSALARRVASGEIAAQEFTELRRNLDSFLSSWRPFAERFSQGWPRCGGVMPDVAELSNVAQLAQTMSERIEELRDWIDFRDVAEEWAKTPWNPVLVALEQAPPLDKDLAPTVERTLLQAWWDLVIREDRYLARFRASSHEITINNFRVLDTKLWKKGHDRVIAAAQPRRPDPRSVYPGSETQILLNEVAKRRRHLPIRRLFERIPNLLQQLKPIMLMSPLSVSQYLTSRDIQFDMVIFDEASQICPEDAVVAIYRAKQTVVAGDKHQLPPTPFFQVFSSRDEEEEDEEAIDEYESVLDALTGKGLTELGLKWHYRSQNENLIAFSNHQFYGYDLITFPHAEDRQDQGVFFEHVLNGIYDRGGSRANYLEAERVVEIALRHIEEDPSRSVGIVAFSISQADAIENVLEKRLARSPEIEAKLRRDRLEGFFIKNLENVQGDERDVMIFSVGYGRDQVGKLTMNFGPLNKSGGQRRLNVAITRAKQKVVLVSSIRAGDIPLTEATPAGVRALSAYLNYAEHGPRTLLAGLPASQGEAESPLEREVASFIRSNGFEVVPQVGCSGYRIDVGVLEPGSQGRFILGVECDGATYHSAQTARDRDRLRQEVLERLGWRIHRVWSTDWVSQPAVERARLIDALQAAMANKRVAVTPSPSPIHPEEPRVIAIDSTSLAHSSGESQDLPDWQTYYEVFDLSPSDGQSLTRASFTTLVVRMVETEGPIHVDVVLRRLARLLGTRLGSRIKTALHRFILDTVKRPGISLKGNFLYCTDKSVSKVRIPTENPDSLRAPEHICPEEYRIAATSIRRSAGGMEEAALVVAIARVFGIKRTGSHVREAIMTALFT